VFEALDYDEKGSALTVVLFHGYGADAHDLAPLRSYIPRKTPFRFVFPDAPNNMWFPIDERRLQQAQLTGKHWDAAGSEPAGLPQARTAAFSFIKSLGVPWNRLVLGGFSQGSMLAADLVLRAPETAAGLVVLSGTLLNEAEWKTLAPARKGLKFFQSHGRHDPILGFEQAVRLERLLTGAGLEGKLEAFDGGHMIPAEVLRDLGAYLDGQARTAPAASEE
jgi:phospholipase/carboxylesterase